MERLPMKMTYNLREETARIAQEKNSIVPNDKDADERKKIARLAQECKKIYNDVLANPEQYTKSLGDDFKPVFAGLDKVCRPIDQTAIENSESLMQHIAAKRDEQVVDLRKKGYTVK